MTVSVEHGAVERMGLLGHQWALVRAGIAPVDTFTELMLSFGDESEADRRINIVVVPEGAGPATPPLDRGAVAGIARSLVLERVPEIASHSDPASLPIGVSAPTPVTTTVWALLQFPEVKVSDD